MSPTVIKATKLAQGLGFVCLCVWAFQVATTMSSPESTGFGAGWLLLGAALYAAGRFSRWYFDDAK